MINRRDVIASGLAVSLLARSSAASIAGAAPAAGTATVQRFVADVRFPEARAAARAAGNRGAAIQSLAEDVTPLYESLAAAWRSAPFALAGLTTKNAFFVIERLAWERGLRTVYRGIHLRDADDRFRHELLGSPAWVGRVGFDEAPEAWAAVLGHELAVWSPEPVERPAVTSSQALPGADRTTLASWLLVPKGAIRQRG